MRRLEECTAALDAADDYLPEKDMDGCAFDAIGEYDVICQKHGFDDYFDYTCEAQKAAGMDDDPYMDMEWFE